MGLKERQKREREERKELILNAARTLLYREGMASITINKIAEESKVSVGGIYFYYSRKEEIFSSLQEEGLTLLSKAVSEGASVGGDAREKISAVAQAYYIFSIEHKDYFDILNYFLSSPQVLFPELIKQTLDTRGRDILKEVALIMEEGNKKGIFHIRNPRESAAALWAQIHGFIQFSKLSTTLFEEEDFKKLFDRIIDDTISHY
jgi:AcrR family transcriptional regulator